MGVVVVSKQTSDLRVEILVRPTSNSMNVEPRTQYSYMTLRNFNCGYKINPCLKKTIGLGLNDR